MGLTLSVNQPKATPFDLNNHPCVRETNEFMRKQESSNDPNLSDEQAIKNIKDVFYKCLKKTPPPDGIAMDIKVLKPVSTTDTDQPL